MALSSFTAFPRLCLHLCFLDRWPSRLQSFPAPDGRNYHPKRGRIAKTIQPIFATCRIRKQIRQSSASASTEALQNRFACEGLAFSDFGDMTMVEMKLRNGSSAQLLLPDAVVTSYKPMMWHRGTEELVYTEISNRFDGRKFVVNGGIGLSFSFLGEAVERQWLRKSWFIEGVYVDPQEYVQVLLNSVIDKADTTGNDIKDDQLISVQYVVTLSKAELTTAISILNIGRLPFEFTGLLSTHLAVSSLQAVYAGGLKGCEFCKYPFRLTSPEEINLRRKKIGGNFLGGWAWLRNLVDSQMMDREQNVSSQHDHPSTSSMHELASNRRPYTGNWLTEKDVYAPFKTGVGKLYSMPPESILIIDRGKRRSIVLGRSGFKNFLLSSPILDLEFGGKDNYVCIGPASINQQVILGPGQLWKAAQFLQNPNV